MMCRCIHWCAFIQSVLCLSLRLSLEVPFCRFPLAHKCVRTFLCAFPLPISFYIFLHLRSPLLYFLDRYALISWPIHGKYSYRRLTYV